MILVQSTAIGVGVFDACSREIVRIESTGSEGNKKGAGPNRGEVVVKLIVDRKVWLHLCNKANTKAPFKKILHAKLSTRVRC